MPTFTSRTPLSVILSTPEARDLLEREAPDFLASPVTHNLSGFPFQAVLGLVIGDDDDRTAALTAAISELHDPRPAEPEEAPRHADSAYESSGVERASARVEPPTGAESNQRADIVLHGPSHGNPFVDVELTAEFRLDDRSIRVGGFYDGDGRYVLRFLPPRAGAWTFTTRSTARSLDGIAGTVDVSAGDRPGPVGVVDQFHFQYAIGTPYRPLGTTSYVWTHQPVALQEETLRALKDSPFTKIRMGLFPKDFIYNANEPDRFVWLRDEGGEFDTTRFDVEFWRDFERRIDQLDALGIQADVIVVHPYDRWGFATQSRAADDRYVRYLARRLGGFANVWWSLANESDLLLTQDPDDWDRLARIITEESAASHLTSIHNWVELWDYSSPWATHCSIQRGENIAKNVDAWRKRWGKPVVIDECGYEGDLDQGWGNLMGEELVRRFWEATIRGGYATHGETFYNAEEVIHWSKGGAFRGESLDRLEFLDTIVAASPSGRLDPLPSDWDVPWGGVPGEYAVLYFGGARPAFRDVIVPAGMTAEIDVIDTWNMTIEVRPGTHTGTVRVPLPSRPFMAIRLRTI